MANDRSLFLSSHVSGINSLWHYLFTFTKRVQLPREEWGPIIADAFLTIELKATIFYHTHIDLSQLRHGIMNISQVLSTFVMLSFRALSPANNHIVSTRNTNLVMQSLLHASGHNSLIIDQEQNDLERLKHFTAMQLPDSFQVCFPKPISKSHLLI